MIECIGSTWIDFVTIISLAVSFFVWGFYTALDETAKPNNKSWEEQ